MATFYTHYDNLKVTRDAPNAVIRAAYKALIQKYHPDIFDGTEQEALRIAKLIKNSYDVLIDPNKRAEHDRWVSEQEGQEAEIKKQEEKVRFDETVEATKQQQSKREHQATEKAKEDKVKQEAEHNQQTREQQKQNIRHEYLPSHQSPPQHQIYAPVTNQSNNFLRYVFAVLACLVLLLTFGLVNKFLVQGMWTGAIAGGMYVYLLALTWRVITKKSCKADSR
jgi:curved DNA-binding protein CbpA